MLRHSVIVVEERTSLLFQVYRVLHLNEGLKAEDFGLCKLKFLSEAITLQSVHLSLVICQLKLFLSFAPMPRPSRVPSCRAQRRVPDPSRVEGRDDDSPSAASVL